MFEEFRGKLQKLTYLEFDGIERDDSISLNLSDEELYAELKKAPVSDRFLHRYSVEDITELLTRHGVLDRLSELGYPDVKIEISTREVYNHRLWVYFDQRDYDHILIELRLRDGYFRPKEQFLPGYTVEAMTMILVDWMMLQNPRAEFSPGRPAHPEQRYPGLGILKQFIPMVREVVTETGRRGVLDVPEHYHGALFYSKWFRFYDPGMEGKLRAMRRDLAGADLHVASHAFDLNAVVDKKSGEYVKWIPGEQILPLCDSLAEYFKHGQYKEIRDRALESVSYEIDMDKFERKQKEMLESAELVS